MKLFPSLLLIGCWILFSFIGSNGKAESRFPEPEGFTQLNLDDSPDPEITQWSANAGDTVFAVTVFDMHNDMQATTDWELATDFLNDIWIFDYQANDRVELVIQFFTSQEGKHLAWIWDDQNRNGEVDYVLTGNNFEITESPFPTLIVQAMGGWVRPDGNLTTNLTFLYDGPAKNMGFVPVGKLVDYFTNDGNPDFQIRIVDNDLDGVIDFEHSRLLVEVPLDFGVNRNGMKINQSNNHPKQWSYTLYWPLLSLGSEYSNFNYFDTEPSIVMDWENSLIIDFGILGYPIENGYHINNLNPWENNRLNLVNFENSMAYYDLVHRKLNFPELFIV